MIQRGEAIQFYERKRRPLTFAMTLLMVASFFSASLSASAASAQTASGTVADAAPEDSVFFMEFDLDQDSEQWTQTFALLERAGLSDLFEEQADTSPEDAGQLFETLAFTGSAGLMLTSINLDTENAVDDITSEASSLTTDPLSVADGDVPEGFAMVFQPEDPEALYSTMQAIAEDGAEDNLATVETTEYNGVTIEFWEAADEYTDPQAIALVGEYVAFATNPADLEPVIDTINGDTAPLSSTDGFAAVQDALTTDALVFGYINAETFIDAAVASEPELAESMPYQGTDAGWSVYADQAGFHVDTIQVADEAGELPMLSEFEPTLAQRVSSDTLLFANANDLSSTGIFDLLGVSLQAAFSDSGSDFDAATPAATPTVDEVYAQLEGQLGFNLQTDLFDQLTGEYGMALAAQDLSGDAPQVDAVFVSGVEDPLTVSDVTDKISFIFSSAIEDEGATFGTRDVEGGSLATITIPDDSFPVTIEYGVVGDELLIGVNNGIDTYLAGPAEPLADDAVYQQTLAALPQDGVTGVQYLNLGTLLPMIEEAAAPVMASADAVDADPACGDYATQEEAQEAYDADDIENWMLDIDFDGEACEDYFAPATSAEATPEQVTDQLSLLSVGSVAYNVDGNIGSSTVLLIGE